MTNVSTKIDSVLLTALRTAIIVQVLSLSLSIALSSIAFALAVILYLYFFFKHRELVYRPFGLEKYFLAYIIAVILMCLFAWYPADAWSNSRRVLLIAGVFFIPLICTNEKNMVRFLLALALLCGVQSMGEIIFLVSKSAARLGFIQHYMTAAGMKMIVLLLLLPFILGKVVALRERIIFAVCGAVIAAALVLTQTRSSWLGFLAGFVFLAIVAFRYALVPMLAVVIALALLLPGKMQERITHMFDTSARSDTNLTQQSNLNRIAMWKTGWRIFSDRPILGVGDGEMWHIYRTYTTPHDDDEGGHLHNNYVHLLATHGIVGLIVVLVLFGRIVWFEWSLYRRKKNLIARFTALGALAAFIGFFISGFAEYNFGDHEILVYLWMTVGLAVAVEKMKDEQQ